MWKERREKVSVNNDQLRIANATLGVALKPRGPRIVIYIFMTIKGWWSENKNNSPETRVGSGFRDRTLDVKSRRRKNPTFLPISWCSVSSCQFPVYRHSKIFQTKQSISPLYFKKFLKLRSILHHLSPFCFIWIKSWMDYITKERPIADFECGPAQCSAQIFNLVYQDPIVECL